MSEQIVRVKKPAAAMIVELIHARLSGWELLDLTESELQALPETVHELIALIGQEKALRLVSVFGGVTLLIPQGRRKCGEALSDAIAAVIGAEALQKMRPYFLGCEPLYVPRCTAALSAVRDRHIRQEYDRMTMCEDLSGNCAASLLAVRFRLSDRSVFKILKRSGIGSAIGMTTEKKPKFCSRASLF